MMQWFRRMNPHSLPQGRFGATDPSGADLKRLSRSDGSVFFASSSALVEVALPLVKRELCSARFAKASIGEAQICAGFRNQGGRDTCSGDSGGPLIALDSSDCITQVGLVS